MDKAVEKASLLVAQRNLNKSLAWWKQGIDALPTRVWASGPRGESVAVVIAKWQHHIELCLAELDSATEPKEGRNG